MDLELLSMVGLRNFFHLQEAFGHVAFRPYVLYPKCVCVCNKIPTYSALKKWYDGYQVKFQVGEQMLSYFTTIPIMVAEEFKELGIYIAMFVSEFLRAKNPVDLGGALVVCRDWL